MTFFVFANYTNFHYQIILQLISISVLNLVKNLYWTILIGLAYEVCLFHF